MSKSHFGDPVAHFDMSKSPTGDPVAHFDMSKSPLGELASGSWRTKLRTDEAVTRFDMTK
jgi:hypothetical protein